MDPNPSIRIERPSPPPSHVEERKVTALAPSTKAPVLVAIGPTTNEAYNWDFSAISPTANLFVDEPPSASSSQPQTSVTEVGNTMPYGNNNEERDELCDENYGDETFFITGEKLQPGRSRQKSRKANGLFKCRFCSVQFTRNFDMLRHIKSVHETPTVDKKLARTCPCCGEVLSRGDAFKRHITRVPSSCNRYAKLQGKDEPPPFAREFYDLCVAGKPPLPGIWNPLAG
ncbi:hypothetical protein GALMADRAFT_497323 [Galerina marginata CBS 339.88]|uniref:C2H2-type domain-containing protein n=1 Tax=Galerina marginata (strain CBS 339.88) TaxID=685588 RepID=A0A067SXN0_GALM3|nr:hypothetical protein GALMADRAFT_497323 [Galerina marginata CBS 339.88]